MVSIKLSEEYIRDELSQAKRDKERHVKVKDEYAEGKCEGRMIVCEYLLLKIKEGVGEIK